jgi:uncharacterized membrane protein YeaQ/YmgE (transglycosylase-associated protein family)
MGFLVLIAVGGILGWVASILARSDDRRGIAINVVLGVFVALVAGGLASSESLLVGLSGQTLLLALAATAVILGGYNLARARRLH